MPFLLIVVKKEWCQLLFKMPTHRLQNGYYVWVTFLAPMHSIPKGALFSFANGAASVKNAIGGSHFVTNGGIFDNFSTVLSMQKTTALSAMFCVLRGFK